jgi:hypothetical protein
MHLLYHCPRSGYIWTQQIEHRRIWELILFVWFISPIHRQCKLKRKEGKKKTKNPEKRGKKKLLESSLKLNIDCNHSLIRFIFENAKERGAC